MSQFHSSKIRNIIFDLGGVLLNINPLLSLIELSKVSGISQDELRITLAGEQVFEKMDTGHLNSEQFRSELCRIMNKKVSDSEMDRIWNVLLLDFPAPRVELLQQLAKNYRVFLLSNTNLIHYIHYTREFQMRYGIPMESLFERLFLSYEIGMHKPDAGIYKYVLQQSGIEASESVFFDDSLANVQAAELQGILGIYLQTGHEVTDYFQNGILK